MARNFVISHGILQILPLNFAQFVPFLQTLRILESVLKVCIFRLFLQMSQMQKSSREVVIEIRETVMEKFWKKKFAKSVGTLVKELERIARRQQISCIFRSALNIHMPDALTAVDFVESAHHIGFLITLII